MVRQKANGRNGRQNKKTERSMSQNENNVTALSGGRKRSEK